MSECLIVSKSNDVGGEDYLSWGGNWTRDLGMAISWSMGYRFLAEEEAIANGGTVRTVWTDGATHKIIE